jgi:very-short-patch-repair endonuclease
MSARAANLIPPVSPLIKGGKFRSIRNGRQSELTPLAKGGIEGGIKFTGLNFIQDDLRARGLVWNGHHLPYNPNLVERARLMRKNMTEPEKRLWYGCLKDFPYRVLRQRPIDNYIVDFYCPECMMAIEVDGQQHRKPENKEYDDIRTDLLNLYGVSVMRFANREVLENFEAVCTQIAAFYQLETSLIPPVFKGGNLQLIRNGRQSEMPPLLRGEYKGGSLPSRFNSTA